MHHNQYVILRWDYFVYHFQGCHDRPWLVICILYIWSWWYIYIIIGIIYMRFAFGPKAQLEPSTNSTLWDLCWNQSTVFPSYKSVFLCNSSWVDSEASSLRFTKRTQWGYGFAHKWFLTCATMHIIFMSEMVLSHPSSMVESCSSSLWLMHGQIVSRENSTGLRQQIESKNYQAISQYASERSWRTVKDSRVDH